MKMFCETDMSPLIVCCISGIFQANPMKSCPSKEVENFKEKLVEENFYLITEVSSQISPTVLISLRVTIFFYTRDKTHFHL